MALGENGVFEGAGAVESPFVLGDGFGEIELQGADGGEGFADGFTVFLEGGLVFGGMDDDLAGESVAEGVQGRAPFAFLGARASGNLRVGAVGDELSFGHVWGNLLRAHGNRRGED